MVEEPLLASCPVYNPDDAAFPDEVVGRGAQKSGRGLGRVFVASRFYTQPLLELDENARSRIGI